MTRKAIIVDLTYGGAYSDNFKVGQEVFVKFSHKSLRPSDGDLWQVSHDGVKWLDTMYGSRLKFIAAGEKPNVLPASSVPPVTVKREVLTIDKIGVGQTFIVHGKPDEVYVKISNSHVFNHKRLQMHTTVAERFKSHLNLVVVELVVYNGK
ncbi:hypothetical protein [Enterobacter phage 03_vB_Eclo_IJM]|nr:hypothetical protein [Enterobacter phage 03_vB_Eclo_IJM]